MLLQSLALEGGQVDNDNIDDSAVGCAIGDSKTGRCDVQEAFDAVPASDILTQCYELAGDRRRRRDPQPIVIIVTKSQSTVRQLNPISLDKVGGHP